MADNFAFLLNKMFPNGLADATYRDPKNTLLALISKNPKAHGDSFEVAVQTSAGGGSGSNFAKSKANNNGIQGKKFRFEYADDFSWARIGAKDMAAAKAQGGVADVLDVAMRSAMKKIKRRLAGGLAGDGSGCIGKISAIPPTTTAGSFKLADYRDARFIEEGDVLVSNPTRVGSEGTMRAGTALVTKVQRGRTAGIVFFTASGGWAPVVNDFIYIDGDYGKRINGIPAWIPDTAPAPGDSFGGVDRSVDDFKLAGIRVDMSAEATHAKALLLGMEDFSTYSAQTDYIITSPYDFKVLEDELEDKKRIVEIPNEYELGLSGIKLADGSVVVADPWFPKGRAYPLTLDTWTLMSMGEAPHVADEDGLKMLRVSDADAFEAMIRAWSNVKCEDPSQNGVIILPA